MMTMGHGEGFFGVGKIVGSKAGIGSKRSRSPWDTGSFCSCVVTRVLPRCMRSLSLGVRLSKMGGTDKAGAWGGGLGIMGHL